MNKQNTVSICPTCGSEKIQHLMNWNYSGLDESVFNYEVEFYGCDSCGLVWNASITDEELSKFYANECAYFENPYFDVFGLENIKKYECYKKIIEEFNLQDMSIADIGCGRAGFVTWLKKGGFQKECFCVDVDVKSFPEESNASMPVFIEGSAKSLPFEDNSRSFLAYFNVLEHIIDINKVLYEANRVLQEDGFLLIDVPDAKNYVDYPAGTGFWFGMREHVYHFTPNALASVLSTYGFEVKTFRHEILPTTGFVFSTLLLVAQKNGKKNSSLEKDNLQRASKFLVKSYEDIKEKAGKIKSVIKNYKKVVFWGVSDQLLSFLPLFQEELSKIRLCDISKSKQQAKYKDIQIEDPQKCCQENACLVISSCLHFKAIKKAALDLGWKEEDIFDLV